MATPIEANILDVTGRWRLNRSLSDSLESTFALQGIPWIVRKIINWADLELQYIKLPVESDRTATKFSFKQTVRPGGFDTKNEYIVDGKKRTDTVPIFGEITMHCDYVGLHALTSGQLLGRDIESVDEEHAAIVEVVESENMGWVTTTVWGFETIDGERRLCKYNTTVKGDLVEKATMVHDYIGVPAE
ncbi:uncharacterized protein TRIVIDRAFT_48080 [Trichoderma virens Gv29-8]|uniref:Lipocalin-like domain-containing protein n=1 Tax=Hypocrea virens (strain Gv29-8 / FGSC 10586) TaxID=413071 RepID=G9N006_HYPVG|nr:uncharacterized protein TRIVIDRAFT_48080 [Trichoderma virens Gv29-8]EHK20210.1 hypothetical protein TRIVIDRAFT_48080 [Trichoderma virens Gv29-8]UKZ45851.1 hypothetical protein TrVGV298_000044 [Trichoderma virens]